MQPVPDYGMPYGYGQPPLDIPLHRILPHIYPNPEHSASADIEDDHPSDAEAHSKVVLQFLESLPKQLAATIREVMTCPISHQFMRDPVVAADGNTYERKEIERWFRQQGRAHSPLNQADLSHDQLSPNRAVQKLLQDATELALQAERVETTE